MANSILQQIANPKVANLPGAFIEGQKAADEQQLNKATANLLQQQVIGAEQTNIEADVTQRRSGIAKNILGALIAGPGLLRDKILKSILDQPTTDSPTRETVTNILNTPEGEEREGKLKGIVEYSQQAGYLPKPAKPRKTQEQLDREAALKERGLSAEEGRLDLANRKFEEPDKEKKSKLKQAIDEYNALPEDSPYREQYEQYIKNLSQGKEKFSEDVIAENVKAVLSGDLAPKDISKRGGLQALVVSGVRTENPNFDFIESDANAKYKQAQGNLLSRALIGGVQPLYDELRKKGLSLKNTKIKMANAVVNWFKEQTGDADVVAFNNLRDDVIAETERILLGSGVLSDTKYVRAVNNLKTSNSPEQINAAIKQFELVVSARLKALDDEPFEVVREKKKAKPAGKIEFLGFE